MLHLPRWATDCLKRAEPSLAASGRPLVLWEKVKGAMRIAELDRAASGLGLGIGQSLSDARAIAPGIEAREIDRMAIEQIFSDFADWHTNASPIVAVLTDQARYGDLCLDITGVSHLFGSEARMLDTLTGRLGALGYTVRGAIAPTVGAAWALAHFSTGRIVGSDAGVEFALGELPVAALRLEAGQVAGLTQLGLKRVGQLYHRNRRELQARFGASLILRLDQALGFIEERVTPRLPPAERYAERRFAEPIGLLDDVLMTARDLSFQLSGRLEAEGLGAQSFHLFLYRVDHKVMTLSVNAARATREAEHIARLFVHRIDRLGNDYDAGFGIDMVRLAASSMAPVGAMQIGAYGAEDGMANLEHLYDRMSSRLGPLAVVRTHQVNSHIPERAVRLEPVVASAPVPAIPPPPVVNSRPLRLLPHPEPITVLAEVPDAPPASMVWRRVRYRFVKSSGPERIGAEWHNAGRKLVLTAETVEAAAGKQLEHYFDEGTLTRDYYVAEDDGGRRFWLFRLGLFGIAAEPRWFMHGFFA